MSRVFANFTSFYKLTNLSFLKLCSGSHISCRCYRKPRWAARSSKSQEYLDVVGAYEEEQLEKIYRKSLWSWQKDLEGETADESLELRRIIQNDETNVRVKSREDEELIEEWVQVAKEINQTKLQKEKDVSEKLEMATVKIMRELEKLKTAINLEDLDEAIERALTSEVEYNFDTGVFGRNENS